MLNQIIELLEDRKIFVRQRTSHETKVIALLIYHAGLSYRKTSSIIGNIEPFSYEALRKWYKKCIVFFHPRRKQRRVVAVDETKVKWEDQQIYIWNAIDIEDHVVLAVYISVSRTSFDALYFLKLVLNSCEDRAVHSVDGGPLVSLGVPAIRSAMGTPDLWRTKSYRAMVQSVQSSCETLLEAFPIS